MCTQVVVLHFFAFNDKFGRILNTKFRFPIRIWHGTRSQSIHLQSFDVNDTAYDASRISRICINVYVNPR